MSLGAARIEAFDSREAASEAAAGALFDALAKALCAHGRATLYGSGGSSPLEAYDRLSAMKLDWARVSVTLADERWVEEASSASNAALLKTRLLKNRAAAASFVPMKTEGETPFDGAAACEAAITPLVGPHAVGLYGMGPDRHVLSWFPGARGVSLALDPENPANVAPVLAQKSAVTGENLYRMTLTAGALDRSGPGVLLFFGEDKREAFETGLRLPAEDAPVRRLVETLGPRLRILWAA